MALNKRDSDALIQKHRSFKSLGMSPYGKKIPFYSLPHFCASSLSDPESFVFLDSFLNKVLMYEVSLLYLL